MSNYYTKPTPQGTEPITTPHLNLRRFKNYDAENVMSWSQDEDTQKYFVGNPVENIDEAETIINCWRNQYQDDTFLKWCVAEAETNKAVGEISATLNMQMSSAEVSYAISPGFRGMGYAAEALEHVISYLHGKVGIHRIVAEINTENTASTKVAENAGMVLEGILDDALIDRRGMFYDVGVYSHVASSD